MSKSAPDTVFELRNYTTHPGGRDVLIELFEREFIESQEVLGAHVWGTFRNLDDPNRFVWIRGFADFAARHAALNGFYFGDVWKRHREAANATMTDSDDVLLLRPVSGTIERDVSARGAIGEPAPSAPTLFVTTYFLAPGTDAEFAAFFTGEVAPYLREAGTEIIATFATEHGENNFPQLPVRANETVFVAITRAPAPALNAGQGTRLIAPTQTLRLQATARSLLR